MEQKTRQPAADCRVDVRSDAPDWSAFLAGRPDATIYHDPRWGQVMAAAYGNRPYYLTVTRGSETIGICQLVGQKSLLFGSHLCSLPYFDTSGILAADETARDALLAEAASLRSQCRAAWVELRQDEPLDGAGPARTDKVSMHLDLPADPDELWAGLKGSVRNQVRKARKADLATGEGGAELLGEFYAIYVRNMRDLGSPPHGLGFFRAILEAFGDRVRLFVVRDGREPVAASLTLIDPDVVHIPWAGSDWRARKLCPNMLLYWEMLAASCHLGAGRFDFGRSTRDAGTYRFKKQWGSREVPLHWHFLLPEGEQMPEVRPDSGKYRFLVAAWKRLPVRAARLLGPRIIRKLS